MLIKGKTRWIEYENSFFYKSKTVVKLKDYFQKEKKNLLNTLSV